MPNRSDGGRGERRVQPADRHRDAVDHVAEPSADEEARSGKRENKRRQVSGELHGRSVKLSVELDGKRVEFPGKVVFVSPEIDPVNGQVRVWAEIDNKDGRLRPGLPAKMVVAD